MLAAVISVCSTVYGFSVFYFVTQHFDGKLRHECVQPETLLVIISNVRVGPDLDISAFLIRTNVLTECKGQYT